MRGSSLLALGEDLCFICIQCDKTRQKKRKTFFGWRFIFFAEIAGSKVFSSVVWIFRVTENISELSREDYRMK